MSKPAAEFIPLNIAILTVSDSRTLAEDTSGQYLVDQLTAAGHKLADRELIIDDIYKIRVVGLQIQVSMLSLPLAAQVFISETACQKRWAYCLISRLMALGRCSA